MKKRILGLLLVLCMLVSIVPVVSAAEDSFVSVKLVRYVLNNIEESLVHELRVVPGETKYATTSADGAIAEGTADNWNLKLDLPADGKATLTLKGATLKGGENQFPISIVANVDLTIVTETDSRIDTNNRAGIHVVNSGLTIITGPGVLTVASTDCMCITISGDPNNQEAGNALIKNANLELAPNGTSSNRIAISFAGKGLTIDNSKINIARGSKTLGIWGYGKLGSNAEGNPSLGSTWKAGEDDPFKRDLVIQNGSVVTGVATSRHALGASGNVIIKDSTVEMTTTGNYPIFDKKPVLEGEYSAIMAGSAEGKKSVFNPGKATNIKYFKVVPGIVELIPTEPTTAPTEPATEPTTEATVPPTVEATEPVTVPETKPATVPETQPVTNAGNTGADNNADDTNTTGNTDDADDTDNTGTIILIAAVALVVLAGAVVAVIIIKKKAK